MINGQQLDLLGGLEVIDAARNINQRLGHQHGRSKSTRRKRWQDNSEKSYSNAKCRVEKNQYLDFETYKLYTCANCYNLMPSILFSRKISSRQEQMKAIDSNGSQLIRSTFKDEASFKKWSDCCQKAVECCRSNQANQSRLLDAQGELIDDQSTGKCPGTWDGLACWPDSPAGQLARRDCPDHVYFLGFKPICLGQVSKQCFANGSWFIKSGHEWSDYNSCPVLPLYATRLLIGSVWHLVSAVVIGPALVVLGKLPNRMGSKRVRILSNLLFWLLVNALLAATQKIGIIGGVFHAEANPDDLPPPPSSSNASSSSSNHLEAHLEQPLKSDQPPMAMTATSRMTSRHRRLAIYSSSQETRLDGWLARLDSAQLSLDGLTDCDTSVGQKERKRRADNVGNTFAYSTTLDPLELTSANSHHRSRPVKPTSRLRLHADNSDSELNSELSYGPASSSVVSVNKLSSTRTSNEPTHVRLPRASNTDYRSKAKRQQSVFVVLVCWILSLGIRITRLLGYAWMFTGAVYLCSVLHFAPAEPPTLFIKWLMYLTNGFPVAIGMVYVVARTIYEPSPLFLLIKVPYHYMRGESNYVDYLMNTQLDCWMLQSKYDSIEEIADLPNLVLIILNGALFVVTLIIMCRINRPGSTRPEMGVSDYFKAAGTLVFLYGAHYALFVYRPVVEGCFQGQAMYYSFLFVDGIQGIAVSYVFCYRTAEGREIIDKCWINFKQNRLSCASFLCCRRQRKREHSLPGVSSITNNKRSELGTKCDNSPCNGHESATTKLIKISDAQV